MFLKNKSKLYKQAEEMKNSNEIIQCEPKSNRIIINNKLYDTSKSRKMCTILMDHNDIPNYNLFLYNFGGEDVTFYKSNNEWFIEYRNFIEPVTESWVKSILERYNIDKYIKLFGKVEEEISDYMQGLQHGKLENAITAINNGIKEDIMPSILSSILSVSHDFVYYVVDYFKANSDKTDQENINVLVEKVMSGEVSTK